MGPITVDFEGFVGLRLNEHTLHTWDVDVALDPHATLDDDATQLVVDHLEMIARYTGKPSGTVHDVTVRTSNPTRHFTISLGADAVSLTPGGRPVRPTWSFPPRHSSVSSTAGSIPITRLRWPILRCSTNSAACSPASEPVPGGVTTATSRSARSRARTRSRRG